MRRKHYEGGRIDLDLLIKVKEERKPEALIVAFCEAKPVDHISCKFELLCVPMGV